MRIARPRPRDAPFKRRRRPPPQATKLLTASMGAVVVFIVLLAIVFVPRFLEHQNPCASTALTFATESGDPGPSFHLNVTETPLVLGRGAFRASLLRNATEIARLDPGLRNGTAVLDFVDADADDAVNPGDYFVLQAPVSASYRFEVLLVCDGRLVGLHEWIGVLT